MEERIWDWKDFKSHKGHITLRSDGKDIIPMILIVALESSSCDGDNLSSEQWIIARKSTKKILNMTFSTLLL